jgi:MFS family permease
MGMSVLLDFPTGGLADKYGRRLNYAFGMLLYGLGYVAIFVSDSVVGFTTGFALAGAGAAFASGSLTAWFYDSVDDRRVAYSTFSWSSVVEGLVGPACGVLAGLASTLALNLPIFLSGMVAMVASLVAVLCLRENYGGKGERSYLRVLREGVVEVGGSSVLRYLILSSLFMSLVLPTFMLYWVMILKECDLPEILTGAVYAILILSMSVGGFISNRLAKRADFRLVTVYSTLGWGVLFLGIALSRSLLLSILFFVGIEVLYAIRSAAIVTFENRVVTQRNRAVVLSFLGTVTAVFGVVANPAIGAVADGWGLRGLYQLAALSALLSALAALAASRNSESLR